MRMMGFDRNDTNATNETGLPLIENNHKPVKSLVTVQFDDNNPELTYYNDQFDLKEGDRVFVSGKNAGKIGEICALSTKFKIRRTDYERVIAVAQTPIHGSYFPVMDNMLSYDNNALSAEAFRTWVLPPQISDDGMEDEIICGEGYAIPLDSPHNAEDIDHSAFEQALDYCNSGQIGYVSVKNGVGRAFAKEEVWHELDFMLRDNAIIEAYCNCRQPGLCNHLLAIAIMLSITAGQGRIDLDKSFVLINNTKFFEMIRQCEQQVTL